MLQSLPVDESLLTITVLSIVIILVLLIRNISRSSIKKTEDKKITQIDSDLDEYARERQDNIIKNKSLNDRINYLSNLFPRTLNKYGIRLRYGVTTYFTKRHVTERDKYSFEDFISMNIGDYKSMCGMSLLFGLKQDANEDLTYLIKNDITLLYSTDDILEFFEKEYDFNSDVLNSIRKEIVLANWRLAAKDYREIVRIN